MLFIHTAGVHDEGVCIQLAKDPGDDQPAFLALTNKVTCASVSTYLTPSQVRSIIEKLTLATPKSKLTVVRTIGGDEYSGTLVEDDGDFVRILVGGRVRTFNWINIEYLEQVPAPE